MTSYKAINPFEYFSDTFGNALEGGQVYIGTAGLDAQTNPIAAYFDAAETIPATQPIATTNGYPSNGGSAVTIYTATTYSITVLDANGALVYSLLNAENLSGVNSQQIKSFPIPFNTVTLLNAATLAEIKALAGAETGTFFLHVVDDNCDYSIDLAQIAASNITTAPGGVGITYIAESSGFNPRAFGATGDGTTDDYAAINACVVAARAVGNHVTMAFPEHVNSVYLLSQEVNISRVSVTAPVGQVTLKSSGISEDYILRIDAVVDGSSITFGNARPTVENLILDCNHETGGIYVAVRHHNIKNNFIFDGDLTTDTTGIYAERNTQFIDNNHVNDCGVGIFLDGESNATVAASVVTNNHVARADVGIHINQSLMVSIFGNVIQGCTSSEILVKNLTADDIDGLTIENNYFENQDAGHAQFILLDPLLDNDLETINISKNIFFGSNLAGQVAIRVNKGQIITVRNNFFRAVPFCMDFVTNSADMSGVFEGNALSTNVGGFVDTTDATSLAVARKFRIGKNKDFNAKATVSGTIASGATSETITHGLDITPEFFQLSFGDTTAGAAGAGGLYVDNITSTTYDVRISAAAVGNTKFFATAWFGEL